MLQMVSGDSTTDQKKHIIRGNVLSIPCSSGHFVHRERFRSSADLEAHIFHLLLQLYSPWIIFLSLSTEFNSTESTQTLDLEPSSGPPDPRYIQSIEFTDLLSALSYPKVCKLDICHFIDAFL